MGPKACSRPSSTLGQARRCGRQSQGWEVSGQVTCANLGSSSQPPRLQTRGTGEGKGKLGAGRRSQAHSSHASPKMEARGKESGFSSESRILEPAGRSTEASSASVLPALPSSPVPSSPWLFAVRPRAGDRNQSHCLVYTLPSLQSTRTFPELAT